MHFFLFFNFVLIMKEIIKKELSLLKNKKTLVAASGGVDSMVLCDLLWKAQIPFEIAHCNFQLRGNDSDQDEIFIQNYASHHQIKFHSKKFDVENFKASGNYSTQMAARELRYHWFEGLMKEFKFDYLMTAHHLNDSVETFFINLSRGSGIRGLIGIRRTEKIIRPLLPFSKQEILNYAKENNLNWREDSSNWNTEYTRNKIRQELTPILKQIHPEFLTNFSKTLQFLQNDFKLIQNHIELVREKIFHKSKETEVISISDLNELQPQETYLFYLFSEYGFKHPFEIQKLVSSENGEIQSETHRLIRNRENLILMKREANTSNFEIPLNLDEILQKPLYLKVSKSEVRDLAAQETLDSAQIKFPLRLRKKKTGDVFYPLGLNGSKKLSKYFKDEKFSKPEKENTWLLVDAEDRILYVMGKRIDDRFKVTEHTHKYLNIYL